MPHFVLECSSNILKLQPSQDIMKIIHDAVKASGFFDTDEINVRIRRFEDYTMNNITKDFIYVFAYIIEGKTTDQKKKLSTKIVQTLDAIFPDVPRISMNIMDYENATYFNKSQL
ncbi:5-carboxymethyl-2-hydroxymuconate Delta-isomerase [Aquimarina sp. W85]|uniref:5-carboxymethyl-2-hydroxymuconate Delta-isomerase n=1 Tax=Aquimarina rhodophyticola TaxID=3342246 RepID=UPI00366DFFCF